MNCMPVSTKLFCVVSEEQNKTFTENNSEGDDWQQVTAVTYTIAIIKYHEICYWIIF